MECAEIVRVGMKVSGGIFLGFVVNRERHQRFGKAPATVVVEQPQDAAVWAWAEASSEPSTETSRTRSSRCREISAVMSKAHMAGVYPFLHADKK